MNAKLCIAKDLLHCDPQKILYDKFHIKYYLPSDKSHEVGLSLTNTYLQNIILLLCDEYELPSTIFNLRILAKINTLPEIKKHIHDTLYIQSKGKIIQCNYIFFPALMIERTLEEQAILLYRSLYQELLVSCSCTSATFSYSYKYKIKEIHHASRHYYDVTYVHCFNGNKIRFVSIKTSHTSFKHYPKRFDNPHLASSDMIYKYQEISLKKWLDIYAFKLFD